MKLYFIRHARQNSQLCNLNVELSKEGIYQAELLGKRLSNFGIEAVYSSDLKRAIQTVQIANGYWNIEHMIYPELREASFGELEGLTEQEISTQFRSFIKEQDKLEEDLPYPGGESGRDVYKRVIPVIDKIIASGHEQVAIITHGTVIRTMLTSFLDMELSKRLLFATSLENSSITEINYNRSKERFYLERFNDYAHLENTPHLLRHILTHK